MGSRKLLRWVRRFSRPVTRPSQSAVRLLVWLALLLSVAMGMWSLLAAHRARVRGVPRHFPAPVRAANVPALGVNVRLDHYRDRELSSALTHVADGGFVWVRQSFTWSQVRRAGLTDGFDWSSFDRIMDALSDHPQLRLVAVLDDEPPAPPHDPDQFAAFAGAFAERYRDQVDHYQIWDEPNLAAHWGGGPISPSAYADLLARTARAIRAADPDARILLAGLAPTTEISSRNLSEVRYLDLLYQVGAAPYFDVVAAKPYGFDTGPDDRRVDESLLNVSRLLLLRDVMVEHGDAGKAIWASHWGWNALPEGWDGAPSIWGQTDEETQAAWSVATLERARDEWPWMGAMIIETLQPDRLPSTTSGADLKDPRWGFSLLAPDGTPRPVYHALADWAHSLPAAAPVGGYPARSRWVTYEGGWRVGGEYGAPSSRRPSPGRWVRYEGCWRVGGEYGAPSSRRPSPGRWVRYEGCWRVGPLAADAGCSSATGSTGGRASFRFDGTRVALTVRRGPYRAFLYVAVDGEPANALPRDGDGRAYVVLYDKASNLVTVPLAAGLEPGVHTVEVVTEGGQGEWPLVDWRVGATPVRDGTSWKLAGLAVVALVLLALLVRDSRRVTWASLAAAFLELPPGAQTALVTGLAAALWTTAALSWGRLTPYAVLPASCFLLSLLILSALVFPLALRPDLGLTLIALTAPFYLVPGNMVYRALSLPEVLVVLCFVAYATRRVAGADWPAVLPAQHNASQQTQLRSGWTVGRRNPPRSGPTAGMDAAVVLNVPTFKRSNLPTLAPTAMDAAVLLLTVAALLAGATADDHLAALFELRSVFLLPALYYALLRLTPLNRRAWRRIVDGFLLGGVGVALIGLGQVALGRNLVAAEGGLLRLQSVYHSPNSVGLYLGRVWPFLVVGARWAQDRRRRALSLLALVLVTAALGLSFSRGALLLALPVSVIAMGWWVGGRYRWVAAALVAAGGVGLIPLLRLPRFAALLDLGRGTTFFRLKLWHSSLRMIRDHPLLGVGPGNFLDAYRTRYILPTAWEEFNLGHAHNILLDHWTRLGVLGVVAGLTVQNAFWRALRRSKGPHALQVGLVGSMAALLAHGLVDNAVFSPDLSLAFFLTLAMAEGGRWTTDDGRCAKDEARVKKASEE